MGRNEKQNDQMKQARRSEILEAALAQFSRRGLAGTKISHIAKAANISQGLLYRYFASKEEVFMALISTAFDRLHEACRILEAMEGMPDENIAYALEQVINGIADNEHYSHYHLFIAQATISSAIPEEARQILADKYKYPYEAVGRVISAGQKKGTLRQGNTESLAQLFWTTINGLAVFKASHPNDFIKPDMDVLMAMFRNECKCVLQE